MQNIIKDNKGFTIIEMMLVCGIVALLSTIAIPSFTNYMSKSKQAEAMAGLGAIFTQERAYFSEKDRFSESLFDIGFGTAGTAKYYDFTVAAPASYTMTGGKVTGMTCYEGSWVGLHGSPGEGPTGATFGFDDPPGAGNDSFTAIAVGNVDKDPFYDTWVMNDKDDLKNEGSDIAF